MSAIGGKRRLLAPTPRTNLSGHQALPICARLVDQNGQAHLQWADHDVGVGHDDQRVGHNVLLQKGVIILHGAPTEQDDVVGCPGDEIASQVPGGGDLPRQVDRRHTFGTSLPA